MKLKKLSYLKYKLINLEFIKSKLYQNSLKNFDIAEAYLKKAIFIIFQFSIKNKKILFVGVDKKIQKKYKNISKQTKHLFLPESYWIKGLLTNRVTVFKYIRNNQHNFTPTKIKNYFLLKKKPNLIVLFSEQNQTSMIKEAIKLKIPVIVLNTKKINLEGILYPIHINSSTLNQKNNNLIDIILNSIFRKKKLFSNVKHKKSKT